MPTLKASATDTIYEADQVDQPVRGIRLPVEDMPIRIGHHLTGHSDLRFTVERSGKIEHFMCPATGA